MGTPRIEQIEGMLLGGMHADLLMGEVHHGVAASGSLMGPEVEASLGVDMAIFVKLGCLA